MKPTLEIHTDKAASEKIEDQFQRYEFSKRIASIVSTPKIDKSLTVGLYGKWGEGKTTVMNFIRKELSNETVAINFNPWLFSDEQHLLKSFFESIAEGLNSSLKNKKEKAGEILSDYAGAIGTITQFMGAGTDGLEKLGNTLKNVSVEKLKKRIDELIIKSGKNIVVFIDDIDLLDVNEVQYIFKLVKLVGDFPRTCYVLAFDDEMVASALAPKYAGINKLAGYSFLEKIIQVPLKIPKASSDSLRKYTLGLIDATLNNLNIELSKSDTRSFIEAFDTAFAPFINNPRLGVRYANTLAFSLPLLLEEVNTADLMVVEGLKIFYPELYDFVRSNPDVFLFQNSIDYSHNHDTTKLKDATKKQIDMALSAFPEEKRRAVIKLLEELFPQLNSNTHYPNEWHTKRLREKRISTGKYFNRYFSFSIQEGDIPDNFFNRLLESAQTSSEEEILKILEAIIDQYSISNLISKLRVWEEQLNVLQSKTLALAIARVNSISPSKEFFRFATTFSQAGILISNLLRNVPKEKQLSLLQKLIKSSSSLEFAMEINHWTMSRDQGNPSKGIFSEEDTTIIQNSLIDRFKKELTDDNLFNLLSDGELWRLMFWVSKSSGRKFLDNYTNSHLKEDHNSDFALQLLKVFVHTISSSSSSGESKTYKAGFYQKDFDSLKEIIDANLLNTSLVSKYGWNPILTKPSNISDRDPVDDKTLVGIFQWFIENDKKGITDVGYQDVE